MSFEQNRKNNSWIDTFVFIAIVVLFAFDVRTFIGDLLPISVVTSGIFVVLLLCFYLLFLYPSNNQYPKFKIRRLDFLMFIFILWYGIRLVYNIYWERIEQTTFNNRSTYIVYYVFLCVLPYIIGRRIYWERVNMKKVLWVLFVLFLVGLVVSCRDALAVVASGDSAYEGRFGANTLLDTIGYGHMALSFVFTCYCLMSFYKSSWRWLLLMPMLFGLVSMGIANSRGPWVALMVVVGILFCIRIKLKVVMITVVILLMFLLNIESINVFFQEYFNNNFLGRLLTIFEFDLENPSGRGAFYKEGIEMFLDNPLFGRSILLMEDLRGGYVHNVIIEVLMSIGIIGGILFLFINFKIFQYALYLFRQKSQYIFFALMFIQYFIFLQFSRSLTLLPIYWMALACVFSGYLLVKKTSK